MESSCQAKCLVPDCKTFVLASVTTYMLNYCFRILNLRLMDLYLMVRDLKLTQNVEKNFH